MKTFIKLIVWAVLAFVFIQFVEVKPLVLVLGLIAWEIKRVADALEGKRARESAQPNEGAHTQSKMVQL